MTYLYMHSLSVVIHWFLYYLHIYVLRIYISILPNVLHYNTSNTCVVFRCITHTTYTYVIHCVNTCMFHTCNACVYTMYYMCRTTCGIQVYILHMYHMGRTICVIHVVQLHIITCAEHVYYTCIYFKCNTPLFLHM